MEIDIDAHEIIADEHTIVSDDVHNFPALAIIINTLLKVVICVECHEAIEPVLISVHAKQHNKLYRPPAMISQDLQARYGVVPLAQVHIGNDKISPVYGLPINPGVLYFCGACHRGYTSPDTLRSHQSSQQRCPTPLAERTSYMAYGQKLSGAPHGRRYFPVDISRLSRRQNIPLQYSKVFEDTIPPPPNFSSLPVQDIEDRQNLSSFLFREGWLDAVKGYRPSDIKDIVRLPVEKDEPWGYQLQLATHRLLASAQELIGNHHGFGLTHLIAQVNPM